MRNFFEMNEKLVEPSYTAIVLDGASRAKLLSKFPVPAGWEPICHHMTINLGKAKDFVQGILGSVVELAVEAFAENEMVTAVKVRTDVPSDNAVKHITIAVNRGAGGKPFMSNSLTNWTEIPPFSLSGTVSEVAQNGKIVRKA